MATVEHFFQYLTQCGYSPLFIISALCSFGFGELGHRHQKELTDGSIAFKERMQENTG